MTGTGKSKLRQLREELGLTQIALAAQIGVNHSRISRYEHGKEFPSLSTFRSLREALGVTADSLLEAFADALDRARRNGRSAA